MRGEKEGGQEYDFQIYSFGDSIESSERVFERIKQPIQKGAEEKLNVTGENDLAEARVIDRNKFPLKQIGIYGANP